MSIITNKIQLAYYNACDGQRIFFWGTMSTNFEYLKILFDQIATEGIEKIELHSLPFIYPIGDIKISMRKSKISRGIVQDKADTPHFLWEWTTKVWKAESEIVESIITSQNPCHRYMSNYPHECAIIQISKGEYDESIIRHFDHTDR